MKIGVLATHDGILAGRYVSARLDAGVAIDCILLDPRPVQPRELMLHEERTRGRLPIIPWHVLNVSRIPFFIVPSHNDLLAQRLIVDRNLDLLVNGGTPRVLSEATLRSPTIGVLNCHPGLLPAFRGSSCVEWALFYGEQVGNSVHLMSPGIDEGPILLTEPVTISPGCPYSEIRVAVYQAGFGLLARVCLGMQRGVITPANFCEQDRTDGRYYKPIDADAMNIVLSRYPEVP
jgi:methionyl-tRNA formyltransferase